MIRSDRSTDPRPGYMPQLDGLRAIAVAFVVADHFGLQEAVGVSVGPPMVRLFFVLSGYLITAILLRSRASIESSDGSRTLGGAALRFWARRVIRIFPIFYLTLFVALACDFGNVREQIGYHAFYLSNFLFIRSGWEDGFGHFWSLAVEEQFYIFWPILVLALSARRLRVLTVSAIAAAPLFRFLTAAAGDTTSAIVHPIACLDTLLVGALLAQLEHARSEGAFLRWGGRLGMVLFAGFVVARVSGNVPIAAALRDLGLAGVFLWAVGTARHDAPGLLGVVLGNRVLRSIGRVSYGIYLYHNFAPHFVPAIARDLGLALPEATLARAVIYCAVTLVLAYASWFVVESPLLRWKDRWGRSETSSEAALPSEPRVAVAERA